MTHIFLLHQRRQKSNQFKKNVFIIFFFIFRWRKLIAVNHDYHGRDLKMKSSINETWYGDPDINLTESPTTVFNIKKNFTGWKEEKDAGIGNSDNWWAILALILVIGTAAGNILVCLAITWERRLQNVTNYFLMSLAVTDLMVAVLVMPLGILTLVKGKPLNNIHISTLYIPLSFQISYLLRWPFVFLL